VVVVVVQATLSVLSASGAVACGGDISSFGCGCGGSPGFDRMWQGPPRGGAVDPQGGGVARATDRWQVPPMKVSSSWILRPPWQPASRRSKL
jgi:hypothetical protein